MLLTYLKRIGESYKGVYHHGYSRITNDIRKCDRLTDGEYRLIEELLNIANTVKKDIVSVERWKLQKMLNIMDRRIEQVSHSLILKGFIKDFEKDGSQYVFTLVDDVSENPLVVLSEIEYRVIESLRPKTKKDFKLMLELVDDLKDMNQTELIKNHLIGKSDDGYNAYFDFIVEYLSSKGVKFKSEKSSKGTLHEQKVQIHLAELERIQKLEQESDDGIFDPDKWF